MTGTVLRVKCVALVFRVKGFRVQISTGRQTILTPLVALLVRLGLWVSNIVFSHVTITD